jgi:hypothetical protein
MSTGDPKSYTGAGLGGSSGDYTITYNGAATSITLDPSTLGMSYSIPSTSWTTAAGTSNYTISSAGNYYNSAVTTNGIQLDRTADIKIGDKSLVETLNKIEDRLAILTADPKKLEKFAALKKAYEHYKLMEKLCQEDEENK